MASVSVVAGISREPAFRSSLLLSGDSAEEAINAARPMRPDWPDTAPVRRSASAPLTPT